MSEAPLPQEVLRDPDDPNTCALCGHLFGPGSERGERVTDDGDVLKRNCPSCGASFLACDGWLGSTDGPVAQEEAIGEDNLELIFRSTHIAAVRCLSELEPGIVTPVPDKLCFLRARPAPEAGKSRVELLLPEEWARRMKGPWPQRDRFILLHIPAEAWAALKARPDQERIQTVAPIVGLDGKPLQPN